MEPGPTAYHLGTRNHLILTAGLAVRGVVTPMTGRLADHLIGHAKPWLSLQDVEVTMLADGRRRGAAEARVPMAEIVLAHEYVALGGDPHLRQVADEGRPTAVELTLRGLGGVLLRGTAGSAAIDRQRRFLAITAPSVSGGGPQVVEVGRAVQGLPYVLVHRDAVEVLLLGGPRE